MKIVHTYLLDIDSEDGIPVLTDEEVRAKARPVRVSVTRLSVDHRMDGFWPESKWFQFCVNDVVFDEEVSADEARIIAWRTVAGRRADRYQIKPNALHALAKAVLRNKGYHSPSNGRVVSFDGEGAVEWAGRTWLVRGFGPQGTPEYVSSDGGIKCISDRGEVIFV